MGCSTKVVWVATTTYNALNNIVNISWLLLLLLLFHIYNPPLTYAICNAWNNDASLILTGTAHHATIQNKESPDDISVARSATLSDENIACSASYLLLYIFPQQHFILFYFWTIIFLYIWCYKCLSIYICYNILLEKMQSNKFISFWDLD